MSVARIGHVSRSRVENGTNEAGIRKSRSVTKVEIVLGPTRQEESYKVN